MEAQYIAFIGIGGTLLGVLIGGIFSFLNTRQQLRSEERKHRREIILKLGFDYWQVQTEFAKYANEKFRTPAAIPPFETYALHMVKFLEMLDSREIHGENVEEKFRELYDFSQHVNSIAYRLNTERKSAAVE